ncbi:GntR family transcriptional regulator [Polaromonas sp. P1-6]|nr:GntR family transcriptional regulator [Polaromonas sp. P1-6]
MARYCVWRAAPGSSLDELLLVERFKSSRTPIREALARLAGDNLVVQHRNPWNLRLGNQGFRTCLPSLKHCIFCSER